MLKYKCRECEAVFDENRAGIRSELIGYFSGYGNYYEHYYVCPECGSDWVEPCAENNTEE